MTKSPDYANLNSGFTVSLYSHEMNSSAPVLSLQHATFARFITSLVEIETVNVFELRVFPRETS